MKNFLTSLLIVFAALQSHPIKAQMVWQYLDTIGGIKRGNYIFPSPTGVYVITDEPTENNPGSYGGQTTVFHRSNAGILDWKRKIDLGNSGFADYGLLAYPKIDNFGDLVFRKLKVYDDNSGSFHVEKLRLDGTNVEVSTSLWGGRLDFDIENNIFITNNNGGDSYLQSYTEGLVPIGNNPIEAAGRLKVLNSEEFYLIGYKKLNLNGEHTICSQKIAPDGDILWESEFVLVPPTTPLDYVEVSSDAVDAAGNIYLLIRISRDNGTTEHIVTKTNSEGIQLWNRKITAYPPSPKNTIYAGPKLLVDHAGNCYLTGTIGNTWSDYDAFACKFDPTGEILWSNRIGYNAISLARSALSDAFIKDGNIYITGWYAWKEFNNGILTNFADLFALKINTLDGTLNWKASYQNTPENTGIYHGGESIIAKGPDSIFVTGVRLNADFSEVLTACFTDHENVNGNLITWIPFELEATTSVLDEPNTTPLLTIFPNPATETIQISLPEESNPIKLSIYSADNKLVQEIENDLATSINIKELPSGLYLLKMQTTMGIFLGKLMKH